MRDEVSEPRAQDVEPLAETPPVELQRAQEQRLLRAWKMPTGWRYWSSALNLGRNLFEPSLYASLSDRRWLDEIWQDLAFLTGLLAGHHTD